MRETNTMPQWAGSCWYYLRFCDPHNKKQAWSQRAEKYWMPVDLYVGRRRTCCAASCSMPVFGIKYFMIVACVQTLEPFKTLRNQGIIVARSYQDSTDGPMSTLEDVQEKDGKYFIQTDRRRALQAKSKKCPSPNSMASLLMKSSKNLEPMPCGSMRCSWGL